MRPFKQDTLLVATHNAGKLEEMEQLFAPRGVMVIGAKALGLPEPDETETTFLGNARIKAKSAVLHSGLPALADDSGIEVDGLDGQPGVYTADWAETPSGRDFMLAMTKTHQALMERQVRQPWTARFCATLVLMWPDGHEEVFVGEAKGHLVWPVRGKLGHGYDPMFQPLGESRTFAEMSAEEKNARSHRADALEKLLRNCFA